MLAFGGEDKQLRISTNIELTKEMLAQSNSVMTFDSGIKKINSVQDKWVLAAADDGQL